MGSVHEAVLYIGMTNDLARRVSEHRSGESEGFATDYRCRKLLYHEHYREVRDAIARETQLKKWSRSKKEGPITELNPKWSDLAFDILRE